MKWSDGAAKQNVLTSQNNKSVSGMLESSEFESSGAIYDAVGDMLLGLDDNKSEDDIKEICDRLYSVISRYLSITDNYLKLIDSSIIKASYS